MASPVLTSGIGRHFDWRYASNRFAFAVSATALALFVGFAWFEERFTFAGAVAAAVCVFMAWAIGRDIDPDHTSTAGIACVSAVVVAFAGAPAALVVFAALIAVRGVSGVTGRTLRWGDLAAFAVSGYASGGSVWSWSIALIIFAWLKVDEGAGRRRWWAMGSLGLGFGVGWYLGDLDPISVSSLQLLLALGGAAVSGVAIVRVSGVSRTDSGKSQVSVTRIRLARLGAGVIVVAAVLLGGTEALLDVGPVACALAAAALVVIADLVGILKPSEPKEPFDEGSGAAD